MMSWKLKPSQSKIMRMKNGEGERRRQPDMRKIRRGCTGGKFSHRTVPARYVEIDMWLLSALSLLFLVVMLWWLLDLISIYGNTWHLYLAF